MEIIFIVIKLEVPEMVELNGEGELEQAFNFF